MRGAFIDELFSIAQVDERVVLLTGDLGFMVVERFKEAFPGRFYNIGVAETNMVGIATGLADAGYIPFCYSIVTFATLRCFEMIRNGPVLQDLPVRIVGVGGGFEYGPAGPTHHGLEDVAVMRALPGMTVLAPADPEQARSVLKKTYALPGPIYYRLGKNDKAVVSGLDGRFEMGRVQDIREGSGPLLLASGGIAEECSRAVEILVKEGLDPAFSIVASVRPAPEEDLISRLRAKKVALVIEAHGVVGGLGSLVCEVVAENGISCRVVRGGVREKISSVTGSQSFMQKYHGLSADQIAEATRTAWIQASSG